MKPLREVIAWLESFAPLHLAEPWDNVGLLLGDHESTIARIMTCLTVTPETAREAIDRGAQLIVSHHPILFRPTKRLLASDTANAPVWPLACAGIAVYSPHTAFDNCRGGINDHLAECLGLVSVRPLRTAPPRPAYKIVVFAPEADLDAVRAAAFRAGAGVIGEYTECSFASAGVGTFFGNDNTNPSVGEPGRRESVAEWRVEFLAEARVLTPVLSSIRAAHSYEEPAIDVYPLHGGNQDRGVGRVGELPTPMPLAALVARATRAIPSACPSFVGDPGQSIRRVAIACGAGDDFVGDAHKQADVLVTGEARYHRALEAEALGVALLTLGHHATERPGVERLADRLAQAFPTLLVWASTSEHDPVQAAPRA